MHRTQKRDWLSRILNISCMDRHGGHYVCQRLTCVRCRLLGGQSVVAMAEPWACWPLPRSAPCCVSWCLGEWIQRMRWCPWACLVTYPRMPVRATWASRRRRPRLQVLFVGVAVVWQNGALVVVMPGVGLLYLGTGRHVAALDVAVAVGWL